MFSTIAYDDIYSSFLLNVTDIETANMEEVEASDFARQLLRDAVAEPKVARLFSFISFDDDAQLITYELSGNNNNDNSYVALVLGLSMVYQWMEPKVQNTLDLNQLFTGTDKRFFAQSSHMAEKKEIKSDAESKLDRTLKDYTATYNSYLNGG